MATLGQIVISNPQTRVKDVYAPAPKIDLTVRANGEEPVMVMDSLGSFHKAGLDVPMVAPTVTDSGSAGSFSAGQYWYYEYVYVSKFKYPLIENAVTGGGSIAPRSNPSPKTGTDSATNTHTKTIACPTSQDAVISHIWIYRTDYFGTDKEASDFATAGNLLWIGEVLNNPNSPSVNFSDNGTIVGLEQIENDNFVCPIFDKVVYADPFFYGFGNAVFVAQVTVASTGLISLVNYPTDQWYSGRNGQNITFDGITTGGYDNFGNFYFKQVTNQTGQLFQDLALTIPIGVNYTGSTNCYIKGLSTVLYRSKIRNPLSWGFTDLVGNLQVPQPYNFSVGGGVGTAIAVVPNLNLLKLDTEAPSKCYVLNLKNAGGPNFETSLRSIADIYCVSSHFSQFSATLDRGQNVLWAIDSKSFSVIACDGSSQQPVSSMVYKTMRTLSLANTDRINFHGNYCPRLELNCLFVQVAADGGNTLNKVVYQHAPTGFWGVLDVLDITCSSLLFDREAGQQRLMVATSTGFVGEMFAEETWRNWFLPQFDTTEFYNDGSGKCEQNINANQITSTKTFWKFGGTTPIEGVIGNWITIIFKFTTVDGTNSWSRYIARIATIANSGHNLTFDLCYNVGINGLILSPFPGVTYIGITGTLEVDYYIGLIEMVIGRSFTGSIPFNYKQIEEFWTTWKFPATEAATVEFYSTFVPNNPVGVNEQPLLVTDTGSPDAANIYGLTNVSIDLPKTFGIVIRDRNGSSNQLMNYEMRLDPVQ